MSPMTPAARRRADRMIAAGLAVAAGLGLTALIAVRAAQVEDAAPPDEERQDLDAYAEQLTREAARLQAYRQELRKVAAELARGDEADVRIVERIAEETRPPGGAGPPSDLDRDAATWSS